MGIGMAALAACGGAGVAAKTFSTDWEDDRGASIARVQQRLAGQKPAPGADVVVGVGDGKLLGLALASGQHWTFAHALDARPAVAGGVVVGTGNGELFALDALTGKPLWTRETGQAVLVGAGDDGKVTVVTLRGGAGRSSILLAVDRAGSVVRRFEEDKPIGTATVLGGVALVPWSGQYLSAIDLTSGDEIGRALLREKASRAFALGGAIYFGEVGIFRFDAAVGGASRNQATHLSAPSREFPGNPIMIFPGDEKRGVSSLAYDKVRLHARPSGGDGPLGFDAGRFYATYYRIVMGFDAKTTNLSWVHTHDADVVGGMAGEGALVVCDEKGGVTALDAQTGGATLEASLGEPVKACIVHVDGFRSASAPKPVPPLAEQIAPALLSHDDEMVTGQRLLLKELAKLDDEGATKTLIEVASDPRSAPALVEDARAAIALRKNGVTFMLAALDRHYDFMKDVLRPPPVGPIAQALGNMKEKRGAAALASHLLDPASTDDDVKRAAAALAVIAEPAQVPDLKLFFRLYRCAAESEDVLSAVVSVGEALLFAGGADGRKTVEAALADPLTLPEVKTRLQSVLQAADAARKDDSGKKDDGGKGGKPKAPKK
jgi:outer membrane protein assembly factor BamB